MSGLKQSYRSAKEIRTAFSKEPMKAGITHNPSTRYAPGHS